MSDRFPVVARRARLAAGASARALCIALTIPALMVLLAACSSDSADETAADAGAGAETGAVDAPAPAGTTPSPDAMQEMIAEWQQIGQQLSGLQQRVMESPEISAERLRIESLMKDAMIAADPTAADKLDRLDEIQAQIQSGALAGDQAAAQALFQEGQQIQGGMREIQAAAMAQEDVKAAAEAFQASVLAGMKELDPNAETMMARADSLGAILRAAQGPAGGPGGPAPGGP